MVEKRGIVAVCRTERRMDHASCHRDCRSGSEPGRLLLAFRGTPSNRRHPAVQVQLESTPPGADARTSLGPGCKTPCSVTIPTPEGSGFSVTYTLDKFQPATVPAQVIRSRRSRLRPRRSIPIRWSRNFSASARRRSRPARKCTGREAKAAQGCRGPSRRGIAVPQPGASGCSGSGGRTASAAARPLIACTAPRLHPSKGADCARVASCLHCARARPFTDITAAAVDKAH